MDNGDICFPNVESILATGGHGPQPVAVNYLAINCLRSLPKHMVPIGFLRVLINIYHHRGNVIDNNKIERDDRETKEKY